MKNHLQSSLDTGLTFVRRDIQSNKVFLSKDASLANTQGLKIQLVFLLRMVDININENIVHYGSTRCHQVTRSVLARELHTFVTVFDTTYVVGQVLGEILGRRMEIEAYVDSHLVFNVVTMQGKTAENRFLIYIHALHESYKAV